MKKYLRSLPVRVRLALSLPLLVLSFFLLWWATGWAWPTQTLAFRALETEYGFGPGEIAAQGEITFDPGYAGRYRALPSFWLVSRAEDAFAVALLEHRPGPLWRALTDIFLAPPFQILTPTEETPLAAALLAVAEGPLRFSDGQWLEDDTEYLFAVCALDPAISRVEVTMNYTYHLDTDDAPKESDPVTAEARPVAEGVWLARVRLPNPLEGRNGGYSFNRRLLGYDAAGTLVYDSGFF